MIMNSGIAIFQDQMLRLFWHGILIPCTVDKLKTLYRESSINILFCSDILLPVSQFAI